MGADRASSRVTATDEKEPYKLPLGLTLRQNDRDRFVDLFYSPEDITVAKKAQIQLHVLRIDAGEFDLSELYASVTDASIAYALSRTNAAQYYKDPRASTVNKVKEKFRFPELKSGEGGEVLLYAFLESRLQAPKLLSKMELKTSGDDYVKAGDGIHLRQIDEDDFEVIFGESKMHGDTKGRPDTSIQTAIADAFISMAKIKAGLFNTDKWLVEDNLLKEVFNQETVDALAAILLPSASGTSRKRNSFGVFIGYEIDVTSWDLIDMSNEEIEAMIREKARSLIDDRIDYIRDQIKNNGLGAHDFHFYMLPFLKTTVKGGTLGIKDVRFAMAKELSGKEPIEPKAKKPKSEAKQ